MANDVKVVINLITAVGKAGFGMPLLMSGKATKTVPYTVCAGLDDVKDAGFDADSATYKAAQLLFMQNDAPAKIAVYGVTGGVTAELPNIWHKDWRQLVVTEIGDGDTLAGISNVFEANGGKMFFCSVKATTDAADLKGNERTVCFLYAGTDVATPEAALVGATAGLPAGSFTYKNMVLKGITPAVMKEAEITAAHEAGCIAFVTKAGDNVTTEGTTCSGEYVDIVDSKDYIIQNIEYRCQKVMNTLPKVPYDNNGIASLEGETLSVLMDAYANGMIADDDEGQPAYSVAFVGRSDTTEADRSARVYNGGTFKFVLAGAIHNAEITGEIQV